MKLLRFFVVPALLSITACATTPHPPVSLSQIHYLANECYESTQRTMIVATRSDECMAFRDNLPYAIDALVKAKVYLDAGDTDATQREFQEPAEQVAVEFDTVMALTERLSASDEFMSDSLKSTFRTAGLIR